MDEQVNGVPTIDGTEVSVNDNTSSTTGGVSNGTAPGADSINGTGATSNAGSIDAVLPNSGVFGFYGIGKTGGAEVNITDTVTNGAGTGTTLAGGVSGIYGGNATDSDTDSNAGTTDSTYTGKTNGSTTNKGTWQQSSLPVKVGFWSRVKSFLFQEIKVELTPKQQKIEDEVNAFLFKEIHFFGKRKA